MDHRMDADDEFKVLNYREFNELPEIRGLTGEIPRPTAMYVLAKYDAENVPLNKRKELITRFWSCYHSASSRLIDEDIRPFFPEEYINHVLRDPVPDNLDDSMYDFILYWMLPNYYGAKNEYILTRLREINPRIHSIVGKEECLEKCPCCGYRTLSERGMYFICHVCFWEDGGDEDSGPNYISFEEGRENFRKFGASKECYLDVVDPDGPLKYLQ